MSDDLKVTPEVMALESELLICGYAGECNSCESPEGRSWASVSNTEDGEEVNCYVCEKCLPAYHAEHLRNLALWEAYAESELVRLGGGGVVLVGDDQAETRSGANSDNEKLTDRGREKTP